MDLQIVGELFDLSAKATFRPLRGNISKVRFDKRSVEFKTEAGKAYDLDGRLAKIGAGRKNQLSK